MFQEKIDPSERVAECERAILASTNPLEKAALVLLRDLWLALINQLPTFSESQAAQEIVAIEKIHVTTRGLGSMSSR